MEEENKRALVVGVGNSKWVREVVCSYAKKKYQVFILEVGENVNVKSGPFYDFYKQHGVEQIVCEEKSLNIYNHVLKAASMITKIGNFDVCHIVYVGGGFECLVVLLCEDIFKCIVAHFIGDDALTDVKTRKCFDIQKRLLMISDVIFAISKSVYDSLCFYFPEHKERTKTVYFANSGYLIGEKYDNQTITWKIPNGDEKIILSVGYCGAPYMHQLECIDAIEKVDNDVLDKLLFIIPMTYGASDKDIDMMERRLQEVKFDHIIIKKYLSDEDMISLRKQIDIFINMDYADSMNAAFIESMYWESIVIMRDSLKYPELDGENKTKILYCHDYHDLTRNIEMVAKNFRQYKKDAKLNKSIIQRVLDNREQIGGFAEKIDVECYCHRENSKSDCYSLLEKGYCKREEKKNLYQKLTEKWLIRYMQGEKPLIDFLGRKRIKTVVIYGVGTIGKLAYDELSNSGVNIILCDSVSTTVTWSNARIIKTDDLCECNFDCILVSAVYDYDEIKRSLIIKTSKEIISLLDII